MLQTLQALPSIHHRYTREVGLQVVKAKKLLWFDVKNQDVSCCQRKDAVKVRHVYARASLPPSVVHLYAPVLEHLYLASLGDLRSILKPQRRVCLSFLLL